MHSCGGQYRPVPNFHGLIFGYRDCTGQDLSSCYLITISEGQEDVASEGRPSEGTLRCGADRSSIRNSPSSSVASNQLLSSRPTMSDISQMHSTNSPPWPSFGLNKSNTSKTTTLGQSIAGETSQQWPGRGGVNTGNTNATGLVRNQSVILTTITSTTTLITVITSTVGGS